MGKSPESKNGSQDEKNRGVHCLLELLALSFLKWPFNLDFWYKLCMLTSDPDVEEWKAETINAKTRMRQNK